MPRAKRKRRYVPKAERDLIAAYRTAAREKYLFGGPLDDGDLDMDDKPVVSMGDDGAYVQAWVWVRREEADAAKGDT